MNKLRRLINEAKESTNFRGHDMKRFTHLGKSAINMGNTRAYSSCKVCGKRVCVIIKPMPNEIEIGGEAVALGCED